MDKKTLPLITLLLIAQVHYAQPDRYRMTQQDYIEKYKSDAIKDMQRTGVPASITLSQGLLESESGNSDLAREANNHFGIKCHKDWTGGTFHKDDDSQNECFRKYNTVLESFDDHSDFLRTRERYAFLFDLKLTDYKGWARGLKKAGYATNPEYANRLIKLIEDYELHQLDKGNYNMPVAVANKENVPVNNNLVAKRPPVKTVTANYLLSANNVQYVVAEFGDTYFSIAGKNNIMLWQVLKYNDVDKTDVPKAGEIVYLQPKRAKAKENFHVVNEGEDMHYISQLYAVKEKKLYKRNKLKPGEKLQTGQKILLR